MREYNLNCLEYASAISPKLERCFLEGASRQIALDFLLACQEASTGDLCTRITSLCAALQTALHSINMATGRTFFDGVPACISRMRVREHEGAISCM